MSLQLQPVGVDEACEFVRQFHRHHRPPQGYKLCVGVNDGVKLVGVLIAGRPVAMRLDDGVTLEVTRCCTTEEFNACSMLYATAWKAAKCMGYSRMITYTLPEESGSSLKALKDLGWKLLGDAGGVRWSARNGKARANDHPLCIKSRWEVNAATPAIRFRFTPDDSVSPGLFDELNGDDDDRSD